ncbi:hypothetical protein [Prosthecochloris sp. HL-130-GSB]|uniref:hypothetical protein n=1 Tax=Prosthecochloris sp. HL-130-GSB TaxID=1974213 RepID=UPI000A1C0988|nr:hypothetical protein [Prosthecochloris sp. HL-130-GSB]ARM31325.1 hypothetical protein B9H02_08510 [Prosthecochloris sp. HL-130-GSB]
MEYVNQESLKPSRKRRVIQRSLNQKGKRSCTDLAYQKYQQDAFPGSGKLKDAQEEKIRQLERELQLVKEERAIVKKAFAVFTKPP